MSYSLQNKTICDTYTQLVNTGSPNLTGNALFNASGVIIPYHFTNTCFNYCDSGYIEKDLTVLTLLSGNAFNDDNIYTSVENVCVFGKRNTITNGNNIHIVGGLSSLYSGSCIWAVNTHSSVVSACRTNINDYTTVIGNHDSYIVTPYRIGVIGGRYHQLSGLDILPSAATIGVIGGSGHTLSSCCTTIVGGRNNIITGPRQHATIVASDQLSADISCIGQVIVISGRNINTRSVTYATTNITGDNISLSSSIMCNVMTFSGKNLTYKMQGSRGFITIFSGCNNSVTGLGANCMNFLLNGSNNCVDQKTISTYYNIIFNGSNNTLSSITHTNNIFNGCNNVLNKNTGTNSPQTNIINGSNNILSGDSNQSDVLANGNNNMIRRCGESCFGYIGTGQNNVTKSVIYTGLSNTSINNLTYIYTGTNNTIGCIADNGQQRSANIFSGCCNFMYGCVSSYVFTGSANKILQQGFYNTIFNGENNEIQSFGCGLIFNGCNNLLSSSAGTNGLIVGGRNNIGSSNHIVGSNLSSNKADTVVVNNLIITNLPVGSAGLAQSTWYRDIGSDIVKMIPA